MPCAVVELFQLLIMAMSEGCGGAGRGDGAHFEDYVLNLTSDHDRQKDKSVNHW